jgi:membrane-bound serine protease (ClpP class)
VFTPGFGLLTAGGIAALVVGSLILFKGGPMFQVNPWLIAVITICLVGILVFVIYKIIEAQRRRIVNGKEELIGQTSVVRTALEPQGMVLLKGELWTAISEKGSIKPGEEVIINKIDGLKLYVTKKE